MDKFTHTAGTGRPASPGEAYQHFKTGDIDNDAQLRFVLWLRELIKKEEELECGHSQQYGHNEEEDDEHEEEKAEGERSSFENSLVVVIVGQRRASGGNL